MGSFSPSGRGIRMQLEGFEVDLLLDLRDGIRRALQDADITDPAMHRLFPPVVKDDDIEDATARMAFHDALLESRLAGLDALGEILERMPRRRDVHRTTLVDDEPALVLGVLNDLRLALASRIGMDHLEHRDLDQDDPRAPGIAVIDHLAWLQEQLVRIIDPAASAHQDDPDFRAQFDTSGDEESS